MKGFYAYLKKELWEQVATFKVLIVVLLFFLLGVISPIAVSYTHLMTPAKINQICEYVSMIQVSLDGSTSEIHDRVRGREGSFDEAVTTIKAFVAKGKQVKVSFATTKYNIDDLENTYKMCIRDSYIAKRL